MSFTILITERFAVPALASLQAHSECTVNGTMNYTVKTFFQSPPNSDDWRQAHGLIIRSGTKIHAKLLDQCANLKVIISATSGFDHIDLAETTARGLTVMHTPFANATSAAEQTWALLMACARKTPAAQKAVQMGEWNRQPLLGLELSDKTYGVIGLGRVGQRVAQIANGFGMKVIAHDLFIEHSQAPSYVEMVSFTEALCASDVLSLHVPLTKQTRRLINASTLESVARAPILINTSRGQVVDEQDLLSALNDEVLSAVGLDVFEREPLDRNSPLISHPRAVLTPHIGATTTEAFEKSSMAAAQKMINFVGRGEISDALPPQAAWFS